jgi:hypothetical protein
MCGLEFVMHVIGSYGKASNISHSFQESLQCVVSSL